MDGLVWPNILILWFYLELNELMDLSLLLFVHFFVDCYDGGSKS